MQLWLSFLGKMYRSILAFMLYSTYMEILADSAAAHSDVVSSRGLGDGCD